MITKVLLTAFVATTCVAHSILDFGAVVTDDSLATELANSGAIY